MHLIYISYVPIYLIILTLLLFLTVPISEKALIYKSYGMYM
jgi:hypothetical protein